jgi:C4-dicarboxylate transporter, DctM subunit
METEEVVMSIATIMGYYIFAMLVLIFSGMPIAFALGVISIGSVLLGIGPHMLPAFGEVFWTSITDFTISAIPLFIFMGYLFFESGLSTRIYRNIAPLMNRLLPGGLMHTNIVVGAFFAACTGSSIASTATIGTVALPEMEKRGYQKDIALGSVAAGGTLGILIPPSITLLVYGVMTNTSIGKLFMGGVIPGIILSFAYMVYICVRVALNPSIVPRGGNVEEEQIPWKKCLLNFLQAWPVFVIITGIMGSIYTGFATATESAAIGCFCVFVLAVAYRGLTFTKIKKSIEGGLCTSCMVMFIYLSAKLLGIYLSNAMIPMKLADVVLSLTSSRVLVLSLVILMYLVMGCLMDSLAAITMTIPMTYPIVVTACGFDPVWFGVLLTMLVECGMLTPPVGLGVFVLQSLRPNYPVALIYRGCFPFFLVVMVVILTLSVFPKLVLFLPNLMNF